MKYTLSQYVHDAFRLKLIDNEKREIRSYRGSYEWIAPRLAELMAEELALNERMAKFETHPHNR